ncbi:hypothetical protein A2Z33_07200 [Candidatus Gottesmanbacteria bacterium RBG_16_52_11]|uniref:Peptidase S11 D-alanyl-D-alanine carboxypeptidase A N-terminal domain-containing protein n=1 Tax=Candidatus Gottesmanbacteria bacterium RBG_16_52_11 TaxID=1798374 RepID=A0A1F5YXW9_9BACT|nr:MAG: hypothetical protein A2Z33_07200 [Candidatus Gottesmanbacteria bacterium RBG_16_52_11]
MFLVFAAAFILLTPGRLLPVTPVPLELPVLTRPSPLPLPKPAPYPVNRSGIVPGSEITAEAIIIRDLTSGVYMYKMNSDIQLSPASTTKILTALVTLDIMNPDDVVTVNTVMNDGMAMGLFTGERMTVENLLYGMLIHSGNDAAYALAENYPGGVAAFVDAMNAKARTLHLTGSSFTNPVGYDDPGHKMTALDLSQLASVALSNRTISKMVAIPSITVSDVTHTYFHQLKNVNQLLGKIPGVAGIKTGWTQEAGENLVTLVERNNRKVIMVVLHSQDRFGDTTELIDWVFSSFEWVDFAPE